MDYEQQHRQEDLHLPVKLEPPDSIVPLTNILNELVQLKYFLLTGPAQLQTEDGIHRHTLPNKEQISCVVWKNVYFITGTDIVRCLSFRFEAFGREITNRKKFEEGIFSDLRNLKCETDAVLEQPKSEFLDYLYRNNCVRTQKKQKIFYWFSVNHDRLFQDALERDLKKELTTKKSSTTPVRDPALSFQYDGSRTLHDQLPDIIEKFPRPLADLADASSVMSNLPMMPAVPMPQYMPYQMMPADMPILVNPMPGQMPAQMPPQMVYPEQYVPFAPVALPQQIQPIPHPAIPVKYVEEPAIQSDFPLDYVEPYVDPSADLQPVYVDETQLATYVPYEEYKPDPAITYDNQQFQVVYHQDESGAYMSSMVPAAIPAKESPKKTFARVQALQPKKVGAKVSKQPVAAAARPRVDYPSAMYFMPTPSESGCSDGATMPAELDPDTNSPRIAFRRPGSRLGRVAEVQVAEAAAYTLKTDRLRVAPPRYEYEQLTPAATEELYIPEQGYLYGEEWIQDVWFITLLNRVGFVYSNDTLMILFFIFLFTVLFTLYE